MLSKLNSLRISSVSKKEMLRQTSNYMGDLKRLGRIPKIKQLDTRDKLAHELEYFRNNPEVSQS